MSGYFAAHKRLGPAKSHKCSVAGCGKQARDWAFVPTGLHPILVDEKGREYSESPTEFVPMCRKHHVRLDKHRTHCPQGHEYTPENMAWRRVVDDEYRQVHECVECRRRRNREYFARIRQQKRRGGSDA